MFDLGTYYGFGIMVFDVPDSARLMGHAGGAPSANAIVAYPTADYPIASVAHILWLEATLLQAMAYAK